MKSNNFLHYKDYIGSVEFSEEDRLLFGKVIGIKSLISYEGESVSTITQNFHNAVDEYLASCTQYGDIPEKSFSNSYTIELNDELYEKAVTTASRNKMPLNAFIENAIRQSVANGANESTAGSALSKPLSSES